MVYDVSIIGSGPAGLSAAIYAKRANLSAIVIEKEYEGTGQIAESGRVDNYLGLPGISGYDLGETFREHAVKLEVEFLEQEVTRIQKEESGQFQMTFSDSSVIESKTVIYAAGASPRRADIPGEKEYVGKGVSYCAICDGSFYRGKKVAVLGGGDTALDDAAYLAGLAEQVYVVHRRKEFRGAVVTVRKRECHVCTGTSGERNYRKSESDRCCSGRRNSDRCRWRIRSLRIGSADGTGKGSGGTGPGRLCESRRNRRNQSGRTVCGRRCQNKETAPGSDSGFRRSQRSNSGG